MRTKTYAILGMGNIGRILTTRLSILGIPANQLLVLDTDSIRLDAGAKDINVTSINLVDISSTKVDVILLATPPKAVPGILQKLAPALTPSQVVISVAASVPISQMETFLPVDIPIARVMPNAPSLVGRGMNPVAYGKAITPQAKEQVQFILDELGDSIEVDDGLMNWCVGLSGAAMRSLLPALEGMTEAGMEAGFSRSKARYIAAQVMLGTAELTLDTALTFDQIKALSPMQTVDETSLMHIYQDAARSAKEKVDSLERQLWEIG